MSVSMTKRIFIIIVVIAAVLSLSFWVMASLKPVEPPPSPEFENAQVPVGQTETDTAVAPSPQPTPAPVKPQPEVQDPEPTGSVDSESATVDIRVGFAAQAPFGVWDELHGEACEEASMAMAVKHFRNETITPHTLDQDILKLVAWQTERGYKIDANAQEVVEILKGFYGVTARLVDNPSIDDIKLELRRGNLVIVPAAGRDLGNPYFQNPGPIYHMLVIRGFDEHDFITNDPGTRHGEGYRYAQNVLYSAIHDWQHALAADGVMTDAEIRQGRKVMVVIEASSF